MACWAHGLRQLLTTQLDSRLGRSRHFSFTTQASFLQILLTYPMQIGSPQSLGLNSIWSPYLLSYNYIAYPHLFCNICSRPLFTIKLSLFTYAVRGSLVSNCELTVKVLTLVRWFLYVWYKWKFAVNAEIAVHNISTLTSSSRAAEKSGIVTNLNQSMGEVRLYCYKGEEMVVVRSCEACLQGGRLGMT
jgi:hypothetical protein